MSSLRGATNYFLQVAAHNHYLGVWDGCTLQHPPLTQLHLCLHWWWDGDVAAAPSFSLLPCPGHRTAGGIQAFPPSRDSPTTSISCGGRTPLGALFCWFSAAPSPLPAWRDSGRQVTRLPAAFSGRVEKRTRAFLLTWLWRAYRSSLPFRIWRCIRIVGRRVATDRRAWRTAFATRNTGSVYCKATFYTLRAWNSHTRAFLDLVL